MSEGTINGKPLHPAIATYLEEYKQGSLPLSEFLALASTLGATSKKAYELAGVDYPDDIDELV
ncbi:MAG: hypothetical protein ACON4F_08430 [Candidatus Puniceispirillaceae bacterium]